MTFIIIIIKILNLAAPRRSRGRGKGGPAGKSRRPPSRLKSLEYFGLYLVN